MSNEELITIIQETGDEAAYAQLFHNLRPIIIHEAEMYKGKIPHYSLEDYIQEGNLLAWKIIFSGNFKGGSFAVYFGKAIRNFFCRLFRDFSMKNLICIGQKEDDHGNVTSILVEAEYAKQYREKQRERNRKYYARKKAQYDQGRTGSAGCGLAEAVLCNAPRQIRRTPGQDAGLRKGAEAADEV